MVGWFTYRRCSPIGVDIGSRSVKLLQFSADRSEVLEAARWDLPLGPHADPAERDQQVAEAVERLRKQRGFRGRRAVLCLGSRDLFVQNIRVSPARPPELARIVHGEAAGRLPFDQEQAEIRFLETDDVRQGEIIRREVILLACHRPVLDRIVGVAERSGLVPTAIDVEPVALLRCYTRQFRREEDQQQRAMFVSLGASTTTVVIAEGARPMFVKYVDVGGRNLDEAVGRHLGMSLAEATALRRHNGDRRADQRDPEITRSIAEAARPVVDRLAKELSMCARYYSVTFRGRPLARIVLGGGEASPTLLQWLAPRLDTPCELGDPLRVFEKQVSPGRVGQWDVAAGLALRDAT